MPSSAATLGPGRPDTNIIAGLIFAGNARSDSGVSWLLLPAPGIRHHAAYLNSALCCGMMAASGMLHRGQGGEMCSSDAAQGAGAINAVSVCHRCRR